MYVLALPGGWIADNIWGQRKAVFVGGCIIALGHFTMAGPLMGLPDRPSFFLGLMFIVIGTGLLKPNVSTMVGDLYPEGGATRDAGFSIFYTGINLGAFAGPILTGWLGEGYNWQYGFSLAGLGMILGLIQYRLGTKYLGEAGLLKVDTSKDKQKKKVTDHLHCVGGFLCGCCCGGYNTPAVLIAGDARNLAWLCGNCDRRAVLCLPVDSGQPHQPGKEAVSCDFLVVHSLRNFLVGV